MKSKHGKSTSKKSDDEVQTIRLKYVRLMAYQKSMVKGIEKRKDRLEAASKVIAKFTADNALIGTTGDAINAYLNEVYVNGLIPAIIESATMLSNMLYQYVEGYQIVDESPEFVLLASEHSGLTKELSKKASRVEVSHSEFKRIIESIDDLLDYPEMDSILKKSQSVLTKVDEKLPKIIKTQVDNWKDYESGLLGSTKPIEDLIALSKKQINQYATRPELRPNHYVPESFAASVDGYSLINTTQALHSINTDPEMKKAVKRAKKNINAQWKNHQKMEKQRRKEVRQHAWVDLLVEGSMLLIGGIATVATLGAAAPLAVTVGAVALSSAFGIFRVGNSVEEIRTGKPSVDVIQGACRSFWGEKNGDIAYGVADFVTQVVSGSSAVKSVMKEGFEYGGKKAAKNIASSQIKTSWKTRSKQFLSSKVDSIKQVAVKKRSLRKQYRLLKNNQFKKANGWDRSDLRAYLTEKESNHSDIFFTRTGLRGLEKSAGKVVRKQIRRSVLGGYSTEVVTQGLKTGYKKKIVEPIVDSFIPKKYYSANKIAKAVTGKFVSGQVGKPFGVLYPGGE